VAYNTHTTIIQIVTIENFEPGNLQQRVGVLRVIQLQTDAA
jgi:hypothetical protein